MCETETRGKIASVQYIQRAQYGDAASNCAAFQKQQYDRIQRIKEIKRHLGIRKPKKGTQELSHMLIKQKKGKTGT